MRIKYTKELLQESVNHSISYSDVIRYLGLKVAGGTLCHVKSKIKEYDIDVSHFKGQAHNLGKSSNRKKSPEDILVVSKSKRRAHTYQLKRAMIESGIKYKCDICNISDWQGQELSLDIDHKNGNFLDNRPDNLRFLCPNCHRQTPNHGSKKLLI